MDIQKEIDYGTFQPGTESAIKSKAGAGNLAGTFNIEDIQFFADIPMSLRLKSKFSRFAPGTHYRIIGITAANRCICCRHIRNRHQNFF